MAKLSLRKGRRPDDGADKSVEENVAKKRVSDGNASVTGQTVILKGVEIRFWSYKAMSRNPRYDPKYEISVVLTSGHRDAMHRAAESAVMALASSEGWDDNEVNMEDFPISFYTNPKTDEVSYTFRSESSYLPITEVNGEAAGDTLAVGPKSIANIAIRAATVKVFREHMVIFYLNGVNITDLVPYSGGSNKDLRSALREK